MAGAGKKTFTAGEVLTASDVNTYLMEQSVMVFGGTAARSSAIPTPSAGMTSYISTTGTASIPQIETYTGSQWQTPYGLTLTANVVATNATTISINNCFSSAFDNYQVVVAGNLNTEAIGFDVRLRSGGVDNAGATSYTNIRFTATYAGGLTKDVYNTTRWQNFGSGGVALTHIIYNFTNPFKATRTGVTGEYYFSKAATDVEAGRIHGHHNETVSYDGLSIILPAYNFTGNVRVFGLRNS